MKCTPGIQLPCTIQECHGLALPQRQLFQLPTFKVDSFLSRAGSPSRSRTELGEESSFPSRRRKPTPSKKEAGAK
jgi:hypothetical protein